MSRHGMVPPGRRPRWYGPPSKRAVLGLVAQALLREAVIGAALYVWVDASRIGRFGAALLVMGVIVLWSYWFGLLRPRSWAMAITEGFLLYTGSVCVGNILLLTLGPFQWGSSGP